MDNLENQPVVVIFGGGGYIGSWVVRELLDEGYRVRVFDNFLFGKQGLENLDSPSLEIMEGDICDIKAVSYAIRDAEVVILLAAIVGHRTRDTKWHTTRNINFLASSAVLDLAIEHGAHRFIFASTNSVYGLQSGVMYETAIPEPKSLYSRLKLRMEEKVINASSRSFHPVVLRIATCHGQSPRMRYDLLLNAFTRDAYLNKKIEIKSGEQWRTLIHVRDAAKAFRMCVTAHENLISGEIFNVGSSEQNLQLNTLLNLIKNRLPDTEIIEEGGDVDLLDYRLSCSKIEKILDFSPEFSISDSMEEMINFLESNKELDAFSLQFNNTYKP